MLSAAHISIAAFPFPKNNQKHSILKELYVKEEIKKERKKTQKRMDLWQQYCLLNLIDPHLYLFLIFSAVFLFRVMLNSVFSRYKGKAEEERRG